MHSDVDGVACSARDRDLLKSLDYTTIVAYTATSWLSATLVYSETTAFECIYGPPEGSVVISSIIINIYGESIDATERRV